MGNEGSPDREMDRYRDKQPGGVHQMREMQVQAPEGGAMGGAREMHEMRDIY